MIDGISSGMMPMPPGGKQGGPSTTPLSSEQRTVITETLEQFDPASLTESDAQSIVSAFSEAGIQPGRAMAEAMSEAGFDARTVGEMAGVQGPPPGQGMGPPPGGGGKEGGLNISQESMEELFSLLDEYLDDDMSEEERNIALEAIRGTLIPDEGLFDISA